MEEIWMQACRKLEISDDIALTWFNKIRQKMVQGSGRFYHNWDELLLRKEDYLHDVSSHIVFAVFFQYYEFDGKKNCVEKNCEAFEEFCASANIKDENTIKLVKKLLGDETIDSIPGGEDEANQLQDLDLLVLGSSPEEYGRYRELLRKEYSHLDDISYKQMRLKQNCSQPSTSKRCAEINQESSTKKSSQSPEKRKIKNKPFIKFRDTEFRKAQAKKWKNELFPSPSRSQKLSQKILNIIKKRQNNSTIRLTNQCLEKRMKNIKMTVENNLHNKDQKSNDKSESSQDENLDDDCICVETKPEIIVIEDESYHAPKPNPPNVVKELENSYLRFKALKKYEPLGSLRNDETNNTNNFLQMCTSTPKQSSNENESSSVLIYDERRPVLGLKVSKRRSPRLARQSNCDTDKTLVEQKSQNCINGKILKDNNEDDEVIVIDDTIIKNDSSRRHRKRERSTTDDSVVFVSESSGSSPPKAPSFIPLKTPQKEIQFRIVASASPVPKVKKPRNELFNTKEKKQLDKYNENTYNPNRDEPQEKPTKRMVIIDGSNVAYQHSLNKEFSVKGLSICIDCFEKMGHEVKAIVPQFRLQSAKSTEPAKLEELHKAGKVVFTPCKNLPGKSSTSYDDRFVLQLAAELDAAIVSNDNYRDLINENAAFKKIIENRVIGYTWCNDLFILPKDPYGKWGPTLSQILNRN